MNDKLTQYSKTIAMGLLDAMHGKCMSMKEIAHEDSVLVNIRIGDKRFSVRIIQGECEARRFHYSMGKQKLEALNACRNLSAEEATSFLLDFIGESEKR